MRRTLRAYIKQYLNRYKGGLALVAGLMIFHIFVLYICGIPAANIRYFAGLELVFFVLAAVFCGIRYWYRLRTVKRQIRDYMQGMQALSDTEDALEEVYMDALEQLQNKRQEEKGAYRNLQREMEEYYALWVHQIKTPISAMRLLLQREEQKQTDPDETAGMEKSVLYDMQQELFWINQYVNMALQYQRMNSGMNDLVLEMVSADQVVRTAIRRFALIMIRKKIAIHYEECREMVLSDEKWLEFVVEQILSNAIKYSGENRAVTIQINRNEADNTCELVISDQGIGIRKEDLPRIFEKGYTGYNGRADKTSTGIGLYLCREITKKLGHGIMITSEIGKGTDVTIVFDGKVIVGTRAKKERAKSYNAFSSINFPYPAVIQDQRVIRYIPSIPHEKDVMFYYDMKESIYVLKLIPGMKADILTYIFENYDAIVIESFGVGGLPETIVETFYKEMSSWIERGKIVVMTTQVANEGSNMTVYEVGKKVKQDFNLLEAYDMTLEATITKLMWLMGLPKMKYKEFKNRFYTMVNHDILFTKK